MAGQIQLLVEELTNDPLALGYTPMSNLDVAISLNALTRSRNRDSISTTEILEAIDSSALMALTGAKATRVWGLLGMNSVDPFGVAAEVLIDAFGSGSTTITALAILRVEAISRAAELGYPRKVGEGHVEMARGNTALTIEPAGPDGPEPLKIHNEVTP